MNYLKSRPGGKVSFNMDCQSNSSGNVFVAVIAGITADPRVKTEFFIGFGENFKVMHGGKSYVVLGSDTG